MKIRSFLAFDIPDELKDELASVIELLQPKVKGIKWVAPEKMHCTIRFFGNVEEDLLMGRLSIGGLGRPAGHGLRERRVLRGLPGPGPDRRTGGHRGTGCAEVARGR